MSKRLDIDDVLRRWPYDPSDDNVRLIKGSDGREVIQLRVDMGLLQLETTGRPDGSRPHGAETYFDYLLGQQLHAGEEFVMTEEQCSDADREFVQFYHRRNCWMRLGKNRLAVRDADHTLTFMNFCKEHSPDEQWTMSHEQYRPFVLFQRIEAAAKAQLEEKGPESAVHEINQGLDKLRDLFVEYEAEEHFEENELVTTLVQWREDIRKKHDVGRTLHEQLADAIASEQYELAARLRDRLTKRDAGKR